jgi:glyoxylase-like metal-dependent hydrolase (beta-lactamase superfamily II)
MPDAQGLLCRRRLLLSAALALPALARAEDRRLAAREIAPDVWLVQGEAALGSALNRNFISNAGFVVTPDGVLVVDALGSPALARELIAEIRRITARPIRYLVVTHYHADHIYGLQEFARIGTTILAHAEGREYLNSETAQLRLQASRSDLAPWIDAQTRLQPADRWLAEPKTRLSLGGEDFLIQHVGPSHTAEDLVVYASRHRVLFAGDLVFQGRIPFVGQADSRRWIAALDQLIAFAPAVLVPGHGPASTAPLQDLTLTRDYLQYLRTTMGRAARELEPFDEAYAAADWSRFEHLPLFRAANRINAYNTYLLMEQQGMP